MQNFIIEEVWTCRKTYGATSRLSHRHTMLFGWGVLSMWTIHMRYIPLLNNTVCEHRGEAD